MSSEQLPAAHAALEAQYEIIRELGRGGTAVVYLATERSTGVEVAIKLIRAKYIEDEEALGRFEREARFVAQLDHPNIVPVRAVVDLGTSGIALVMAHVAGKTLKQVIRAEGRLSPVRTEQIMRDIGRALAAAHDKGIVHRDVKPENIFVDTDGRALLADFGLARSMTADTQLTMVGVAIGTPAYMAPEQIESGELDARADVYSLGLVAWEMVTGSRPWDGQSLYAVLYSQKHELLTDVRDVRDDVPDRLAEVILRSIEKDRDMRWQSMEQMLGALDDSTPLWVTPRHRPAYSPDTTRFVRPVTTPPVSAPQPVSAPPPPVSVQPLPTTVKAPAFVELPATPQLPATIQPPTTRSEVAPFVAAPRPAVRFDAFSPVAERRIPLAVRSAAALAAVVVFSLVTIVVRGRSQAPREPERMVRPNFGDVGKPIQVGAPIDSLAFRRDTVSLAATDTSARAKQPIVGGDTGILVRPAGRAAAPRPEPASRPVAPSPATAAPATTAAASEAPPRPTAVTPKVSIVAGGMHSCLIGLDGRAFCWGGNDRGQLGTASTARATAPLIVAVDAPFVAVAAGLSHSCAIARGGAAWCWGSNDHGQLGDRSIAQRIAPARVAEDHLFRSIATGGAHTCGLDADGIAWCWGSDAKGQLGRAGGSGESTFPIGVGFTRFASIAAGWNFTCALTPAGRASCWGENAAGQLGDGTTTDRSSPTPVASDIAFTSIATGSSHTCGVTALGEAFCWGRNTGGQLGDGTTVDRTTPVRVRANARFVAISAGGVHTCAITGDGDAYCWGRNTYGQLGDGTNTDASQPARVSGGHAFVSVRGFGSHTCGATASGEAFCWGYNLESQLGDGTRIHRSRPVRVMTPGGG